MAYIDRNTAVEKEKKGGTFVSLKNDKDHMLVRILYAEPDDIRPLRVHKVPVNGKDRYVNCLRGQDDPSDVCPLCEAGFSTVLKLWIPCLDIENNVVKFFERGIGWVKELETYMDRYSPFHDFVFDLVRNGKPKDKDTRYVLFPMPSTEEFSLKDVPEYQDPLGGFVIDKPAEELREYLSTGKFNFTKNTTETAKAKTPRDSIQASIEKGISSQNNPFAKSKKSSVTKEEFSALTDDSDLPF